ncbi:hybrid sensor histidine kinase/response regulator [Schlesneria paludicola]|uniref:hybrid sensor histidine kinase/response regulator n=1 Tax=Schlesneria paludicola TaxID=360056 RepID=UPI00029B500E|nr:PAS domain-containing protein [Schlesneria paludicola]
MDFFRQLFNTSSFPARWSCGQWSPGLGWLHILSDLGIWSAYFAIPIVLAFFAIRRRDLPFRRIFFLFGLFILLCGTTHLMDAIIFWWPAYRLAGLIKLVTAVISWITVLALIRIVPTVIEMRSPEELEHEIAARRHAEAALGLANAELERRVNERTRELTHSIATLHKERELFRTTLASICDGVVVTDLTGSVTFVNGVAEALMDCDATRTLGTPLNQSFRPIDEQSRQPLESPIKSALREGAPVNQINHAVLISRTGIERPIDASAAPLRDEHGSITGAVLVFRDISERRQRERERDARERVFRTLAEWIPQLAWMANPDGHVFWYNRRWYDYTGTTFEQVEGWGWESFVHPDERPKVMARWKSSIATGEPFDMEFTIRDRSNNYGTFLTRVMPVRDDKSQIVRWFGTNTDITELKQAREALAASEKRLRLALDAGSMGVLDWDLRTNHVVWSERLEALHGLPAGAFGGTYDDAKALVHPDDRARVDRCIHDAMQHDADYDVEFRNVWPDRSVHWTAAKGKVLVGTDGRPERMIGVCMDINQRKRSEQTARFLAETSAALTTLGEIDSTLQNVASLVVPGFADWITIDLLEDNGRLRRVAVAHDNPAKVELANEIYRRFPPDPNVNHGVWQILRTGESEIVPQITDEILNRSIPQPQLRQTMQQLGLKSYIGVPLNLRGKTLGVMTFVSADSYHIYDDTDLALAQDLAGRAAIAIENSQLYRNLRDADRRKDEFLATLAHELRNPLAPIRNGLQLLPLIAANRQTVGETIAMMERQVTQLVRLVDDLMDVSRINRGKLELRTERVALSTIVQNAVETSRPLLVQMGHQLSIQLPEEPTLLQADPVRLAQAISNLLNNAAKYGDRNGQIALTATVQSAPPATEQNALTAAPQNRMVTISVKDSGIGIAPEQIPHLFVMFSQVSSAQGKSQGGLGIGLTLVKQLVEMHGGQVEAKSEGPGLGSEFIIRLPLVIDAQNTEACLNGTPPDEPPQTSLRVLIVDDNRDAAESLAMMLRCMGNDTRTAYDGPDGIDLAREYHPDIILLDIGLPTLNGYEVCRQIRQEPWGTQIAIFALTGWGQDDDRRQSHEAGFDHHFVKPVDPQLLMKTLRERQQIHT